MSAEDFFESEASGEAMRKMERKMARIQAENRHLKSETKALLAALDEAEELRDVALSIDMTPRPLPDLRVGTENGGATVVALLSDVHVGASVKLHETGGLNEFNPDICRRRLYTWAESLAWTINEMWGQTYDVEELLIGNIGDVLEGMIHEELKSHNTMTPTREVQWWMDEFPAVLRWLMDNVDVPHLTLYMCDGNHGRNTKKLHAAGRADWSLTHLAFHAIKMAFADEADRLKCIISTGHRDYIDVYRWTLRFEHGDSFRYAGGVGGLAIPFNKYVYRLNQTRHADHTLVGHWHDCQRVGANVVNGTVKGVDAFTEKLGFTYQPPTQWAGLISRKWGLEAEKKLVLDRDMRAV